MAGPHTSQNKPLALPSLVGWGITTTNTFRNYLTEYRNLPQTKKLLQSMIKFSEMYKPPSKTNMGIGILKNIWGKEEIRKLKRAQIYMRNKDLITTKSEGHGKRIVVTSQGHKVFFKSYPLAKLRKTKWRGSWTLVMYDFPEKIRSKRDYLRRKLTRMGFGSPQISTLISPLPLEKPILELLKSRQLENYVWVLTCKKLWGLSDLKIAKRSWPLDKLNTLYGKLLEALPTAKEGGPKLLKEWGELFLATSTKDPYLPVELLPQEWLGGKCRKEFIKLGPLGPLHILLETLKGSDATPHTL